MSELYDILKASNFSGSGDDGSAYAHSLELTINSQTYVLTATLKNTRGETLGTPQTIDLPLETMVVNGAYDNTTKKVILTLKNGNTVDFSVADLVDGLQSEITPSNKLNSDLINDTNQNNKFVTSAEKTKIANALTEEVYNAGKTTPYGTQYVIAGETYTVGNHAEIFNSYANNKAIGEYSHAEGDRTTATGSAAHAEGGALLASGTSSHAEGGGTTASGNYSHAEGNNTTASGLIAHAEGEFTNASGRNAHTEGQNTNANGECSHTEGTYTIASGNNQHVQGKYNIEDSNSKYAFIIGNGTANNNRSNAFAVDWNGKIYVNNSETGTDVSTHDNALVELIDSGQKNLLRNEETSREINGVTFTILPDGSVELSGTASADITTYRIITEASVLSGDMVLSGCPSGGASNTYKLDVLNGLGGGILANDYGSGAVIDWSKFTSGKFTVRIRIQQGTNVDGLIFKPMICSKAAWDISQNYVPYRPSYDKLSNCKTIWEGTQSEYEALVSKNYDLYMIYEEENQNGD